VARWTVCSFVRLELSQSAGYVDRFFVQHERIHALAQDEEDLHEEKGKRKDKPERARARWTGTLRSVIEERVA